MISNEEIDALSEDNDEAFVEYESIIRKNTLAATNSQNWDAERSYVTQLLAFVEARPITIKLPALPSSGSFPDWYESFRSAVERSTTIIRLNASARKKANITVLTLSGDYKVQIGGHLTAIRKIVAESELSENKRDAIMRRINTLQEEVDRDRTRTEAAMALWLDITSAIGNGASNLDPAIDRLERIIKVFAKARDENEKQALLTPPERKRISPPTSAVGSPKAKDR